MTRFMEKLAEEEVDFLRVCFTDTLGEWRSLTVHISALDPENLEWGVDGSSLPGWTPIEASDLVIKGDPDTLVIDPMCQNSTAILFADIYHPKTGEPYARDPRSTAKRAEAYLRSTGIATEAYFGPEPEFFVFDEAAYGVEPTHSFFALRSIEGPQERGEQRGDSGFRPLPKGGYFANPPTDAEDDLRSTMLENLDLAGIAVEKHHHEVSPSQHELGFKYAGLTRTGDNVMLFKYILKRTAQLQGKSVTFMPKPIMKENGSGMHIHQSLFKGDTNLFTGEGYAGLSELALYYIGGIIKHGRALNAITNPTTNSYKRLVPGYEAPVMLAYSACNRTASIRIPYVNSPKARRIETRFPDPAANPYLACSALLMAGLDGILNKIHPGEAWDQNLYELSAKDAVKVPHLSASLTEALDALESDHTFLLAGGVFTQDQVEAYIELRREEAKQVGIMPNPMEFSLYYQC